MGPDLALLVRRKNVDNTVNCLGCVLSVERREDQVTGLSRSQSNRNCLKIAKFTDENHVGVLAQDMLESGSETMGVRTDFTLINDGFLVMMQKFDWIFDGDDVIGSRAVHQIDECSQGGRLTRTCWTSH